MKNSALYFQLALLSAPIFGQNNSFINPIFTGSYPDYGIGSRVYYKKGEVMRSIKKIN
jgi:hypothetical protein